MNRSFQFILFRGLLLIFFYILPIIVLCGVFAYQRMVSAEKRHLKAISISILDRLSTENSSDPESLSPETRQFLTEGMNFVSPKAEMYCAVLGKDRRPIWQTPNFNLVLKDRFFKEPDRNKLFFLGISREEECLKDSWSTWRFLYRRQRGDFTVFVSSVHEFELAERAIELVLVGTLVALGLAFWGGWLHTRRVLRPYQHLRQVMQLVRSGDLSARVDENSLKGDTLELVTSINRTLDELEESFARISQFSSDAAHEIRTPLAAVCGTLEVALAHPRSVEEYEDLATKCLEQMSGLKSMTEKLLLLARPGVLRLENLPVIDLKQLAVDQIETLEFLARKQKVDLRLHADNPVEVRGDSALLGTMIRNLIDNAIKASSNGMAVDVSVGYSESGKPMIQVRDQGLGIPRNLQEKIFERFFQMDENRASGKGLGLAMVRWIAEGHQGKVSVESRPGEGAEFIILFPKS